MATSFFALRIIRKLRNARQREDTDQEFEENLEEPPQPSSFSTNTCRICLKEGCIPIFGGQDFPDISQSVQTFGDIKITQDDNFPKHLCETCYSFLKTAISFRKSAKESEEILQNETAIHKSESYFEDLNVSEDNQCSDNEVQFEAPKAFYCKLCKISFITNEDYSAHKNSKQHRNIRIQCSICNRLLTAQLYKRHLMRHESASHLICEVCGKMYRKDNLIRHLQLHSFELPFQCSVCPYRGRYMDSLKIHMRGHRGEKPFSCDKCQLHFLTRSNLNRHLLTHKKERPFKCNECVRGFYTKKDLEVHFKSDHAGIKEFGCRLCGNKYGTRKALMRHELRVHKRDKMAKGRLPLYLQAEYRKDVYLTES